MRIVQYFALLLIAVIVSSCGGAGGSNFTGNSALAATYKSDFTRGVTANTTLFLFIDNKAHVGAQISNATGVLWAGQGTISGSSLNVSLSAVSSSATGAVLCQGTVVPGNPATLNITLSGSVTDSFTATRYSSAGVLPYGGDYNVTTTGDENGSGSITISETGSVTGSLDSPTLGNGISIEGTVDLDGRVHLQAQAFAVSGQFDGYVFLPVGATQFTANGTWQLNSINGTWSAAKVATP